MGTAAKDSGFFKRAMLFIIVGIAAGFFNVVFDGIGSTWSGYVGDAFEIVKNVAELLSVLYIVDGIIDFAQQFGDAKVQQKGITFKWLLIIVYGLAVLLVLIGTICGATAVSAIAVSAIALVAAVLSVVKYFVYLTLLAAAKKMWEKSEAKPVDASLE